jgi:hypothetical protein
MPTGSLDKVNRKNGMSKQNLLTIVVSVVLSIVASTVVNLAYRQKLGPFLPEVIRAKSFELTDTQGHVLGLFELISNGQNGSVPHLVMRDASGRDSIEMGIDTRGDGALGFSSDHWNEGAVILGHLQNADDGSASISRNVPDRTGAWGLQVRSVDNKLTGVGFFNSGRPIAPIYEETKR